MKIEKRIAHQLINNTILESGQYYEFDKRIDIDLSYVQHSHWQKVDEDEKTKVLDYYIFWNEHNLEDYYDVINMQKRTIYMDMQKVHNDVPLFLKKVEYIADLVSKNNLKDYPSFNFEPKLHLCYKSDKDFVLMERI